MSGHVTGRANKYKEVASGPDPSISQACLDHREMDVLRSFRIFYLLYCRCRLSVRSAYSQLKWITIWFDYMANGTAEENGWVKADAAPHRIYPLKHSSSFSRFNCAMASVSLGSVTPWPGQSICMRIDVYMLWIRYSLTHAFGAHESSGRAR